MIHLRSTESQLRRIALEMALAVTIIIGTPFAIYFAANRIDALFDLPKVLTEFGPTAEKAEIPEVRR